MFLFNFGTYMSSFRYNRCSRERRQTTEKKDESANHKSSRYKKKEKFGSAPITVIKIMTNNSYANNSQRLFVKT